MIGNMRNVRNSLNGILVVIMCFTMLSACKTNKSTDTASNDQSQSDILKPKEIDTSINSGQYDYEREGLYDIDDSVLLDQLEGNSNNDNDSIEDINRNIDDKDGDSTNEVMSSDNSNTASTKVSITPVITDTPDSDNEYTDSIPDSKSISQPEPEPEQKSETEPNTEPETEPEIVPGPEHGIAVAKQKKNIYWHDIEYNVFYIDTVEYEVDAYGDIVGNSIYAGDHNPEGYGMSSDYIITCYFVNTKVYRTWHDMYRYELDLGDYEGDIHIYPQFFFKD